MLAIKEYLDRAIECYQKAVEHKQDDNDAWYNMGNAWDEKGDLNQAIECYQKVVKSQPNDHEAWHDLGWDYLITGKLAEAKAALEQCRKWSDDKHSTAPMNLGHVPLALGEREAALACYRRSLELFEDKAGFFQGMEDDWQHLAQYGIGREVYEGVVTELRAP